MKRRPYGAMLKRELLAEIVRLERMLADDEALATAVRDFHAQRQALAEQQAQLAEAQRILEASTARYTDLFEFAPIGYALLDRDGMLEDLNLTAAKILKTQRVRLNTLPFLIFVARSEQALFLECLTRCRRSPEAENIELTIRSRTGDSIPCHLTVKQLRTTTGAAAGFHLGIIDLSERKRLELERLQNAAERRQAEYREQLAHAASESKDRFIAMLSHELRTPLAPIALSIAALERAGKVTPELAPTFAMIKRNVNLETRLIDDLLDITRITQGKLHLKVEVVDVHAIVQDVKTLCAGEMQTAGVEPALELDAAQHHVLGDATRLRQVVWNLMKNAMQHTPPGGRIAISTANQRSGEVRIVVRDSGSGIAPDKLTAIFRPFEQGDIEFERGSGLGLGLAICKGIMDAHGGHIEAANALEGKGATFTVELATVDPTMAINSDPQQRQAVQALARRTKILLVEDDPDNAFAVAELLRLSGYRVESADSVETALQKARNGFDILVSDIRLPDGNGRDVVRELREHGRIRAIALTGYGTREDVSVNLEAGFSRHLTKPVAPEDLLAAVGELAESEGTDSELKLPAPDTTAKRGRPKLSGGTHLRYRRTRS